MYAFSESFSGLKSCRLCTFVQEDFRPYAEGLVPEVNKSISLARQKGIPIFFSQHGHTDDELSGKAHSVLAQWWGKDGSIR